MKLLIQDFPVSLIFWVLKSRDFNDGSPIFPISLVRFPLLDYISFSLKSRDFNEIADQ